MQRCLLPDLSKAAGIWFITGMLIEAMQWWAARVAELVPEGLVRPQPAGADAIVIATGEAPGSPAALLLRRNGQEAPLGYFYQGTTDRMAVRTWLNGQTNSRLVLLRPPRGALLEKLLVLPSAVERGLQRVISYEMSRVTPFEAGDVFWTATVLRHDRPTGRLHVRLSLVPKTGLQPLLAALGSAGLSPAFLEALPAAGPARLIPLQQETIRLARQRRVTGYLASGCAVLAAIAIILPFLLQSLALGAMEDRIAAVLPQVTEVQALRKRIAAESAGQGAIADERARVGNTLEVLADVTQLLPDDTFLNDLTLSHKRLTISGQSAAAPKLIAGLAADPLFRNPGFAAPVTRNTVAGRDAFSISSEVGP